MHSPRHQQRSPAFAQDVVPTLTAMTLASGMHSTGPDVVGPLVDPKHLTVGIVHLGLGAFHRSHQAVFTEDATVAAGDRRWGILGVGRGNALRDALRQQDGLYGVLFKSGDATRLRLVGSLVEVASLADSPMVRDTISNPDVHIVSLTVTEKGYLRSPTGEIDLELPGVRHDLAIVEQELAGAPALSASRTLMGLLMRGLVARHLRGGPPVTLLSCDNISRNGEALKLVVTSFAAAIGPSVSARVRQDFQEWLAAKVTAPSSMVDRITPRTRRADREEAAALSGVYDDCLVVAEPFAEWAIEDDFAGDRPRWELARAVLTDDVAPYEEAKLRILNASHSMFAYLGSLKGHRTIAEAVSDERLRHAVTATVNRDVLPTLDAGGRIDLQQYRDEVLNRFLNRALAHTTAQVAADGSQKIRERFVGTIEDRLAAGAIPDGLALAVAAWIGYVASTMRPGGPDLEDPMAAAITRSIGDPDALADHADAVVSRVLGICEIFGRRVAASQGFATAVANHLTALPDGASVVASAR